MRKCLLLSFDALQLEEVFALADFDKDGELNERELGCAFRQI
jgi:hypothetical protein